MKTELSDEELDLIVKALENYYAYTIVRKSEDARYRDLAERLKRKPAEKVAHVADRHRKVSNQGR